MSTTKKLPGSGLSPKTESIKLTFACPAGLKADLDRYAVLHAQTYGETGRCNDADPAHAGGVHRRASGIQQGSGSRQGFAAETALMLRTSPLASPYDRKRSSRAALRF
ncbi:hypothetical protein PASLES2_16265 [Pseudomonas aeruginosa]